MSVLSYKFRNFISDINAIFFKKLYTVLWKCTHCRVFVFKLSIKDNFMLTSGEMVIVNGLLLAQNMIFQSKFLIFCRCLSKSR
jgi:hypothetical protein